MVGLKSSASVQRHIEKLFKEGKLETDAEPGTPRAIRIPGYKLVEEENV
jgi:SOS-response transcriptional repressor LexA